MQSVEIVTRVERRRRWSREEKQRLVAESARPDRTVSQVARTYGLAPNLLFTWRRQFLAAAMAGAESSFVPVRVREEEGTPPEPVSGPASVAPRLEIRLPSGIVISVAGDVTSESLRRVLAALGAP